MPSTGWNKSPANTWIRPSTRLSRALILAHRTASGLLSTAITALDRWAAQLPPNPRSRPQIEDSGIGVIVT